MKIRAISIRTTISLLMAIMLTILIIVVSITVNAFLTNAIADIMIRSTTDIITQINNNAETYINDITDIAAYARNLARDTSALNAEGITERLKTIVASRNDIVRIDAFGMDGKLLLTTSPVYNDASPDELWFQRAVKGEGDFFFTGPRQQQLPSGQKGLVITFSQLISYGDMNRATSSAVLSIDLNFNFIRELAEDANLADSGYIYFISNDGEIIYHPRQSEIDDGTFHEDLESVADHVYGTYISEFDNHERMTIIQTVSQTRWRIVGVAMMDEIMNDLGSFQTILLLISAIMIIISIIITAMISKHITSPLRRLEIEMKKVETGDFEVSPPHSHSLEVESLSSSFRIMVARIKVLMKRIKATEESKRQRELDALQAKINPHFLYNTLDSVIWMAETGDNQGVVKMVSALARLFRISIAKGHDVITLAEELSHVQSYLDIQSMRYKDKFTYSVELPQELEDAPTIKLIIQPIVENSIYHGIKYLQEEGRIEIRATTEEDDIRISNSDNEIGMKRETAEAILNPEKENTSSTGNGIGLRNIDERIKLSYGRKYGLSIWSEPDEGTVVTILIPHLPPIEPVVVKS